MNSKTRVLDLTHSSPWFGVLLAMALLAFWPSYLSQLAGQATYTHLHAITATMWVLLLIAQPWAIRNRRNDLHRMLGKASFVLAPILVVVVLLAANNRFKGLEGQAYAIQTYILYLQVSIIFLFALCYTLAIANRRDMAVHSRLMVCTALTLVDPITIRLMFWWDPMPGLNYNWVTFAFTDLLFLLLIWLDRDAKRGRWVFPAMLSVFFVTQLPVFLGLTGQAWWQGFAAWYAGLPLT